VRKALIAAVAVAAALPMASPAVAAEDAFNSQGLRKAVTVEGVRDHQAALQAVADANGGTRASGTPGYAASAAYVRGRLEASGYKVIEQQFSFPWATSDQSTLGRVSPNPRTYTVSTDFRRFNAGSTDGAVTAPIQVPPVSQTGCTPEAFAGFTAGNIALIERGPAGCTFNTKAVNAKAAGAVGVLFYNNVGGALPSLTIANPDGTPFTLPALIASQAAGQELRALAASGPVVVAMEAKLFTEFRQTTNLWAETSGDPIAPSSSERTWTPFPRGRASTTTAPAPPASSRSPSSTRHAGSSRATGSGSCGSAPKSAACSDPITTSTGCRRPRRTRSCST
jgi:hypothetical protein